MKDFKELIVWQKAVDFVTKVYQETKLFPKEELYGLVSQIRRAAVSVPANISEGYTRRHTNEYIQFLYISLGSCGELETLLIISKNLRFISSEKLDALTKDLFEIKRMLNALINSLRRKTKR